jgi:hypothetical protein
VDKNLPPKLPAAPAGTPDLPLGKTADPKIAPPLAIHPANGDSKPVSAHPPGPSVIPFGGNRGGRPRKDGLTPGSEAALKADREKDAKRKRDRRVELAAQNPPVLPSAPVAEPGEPIDPNASPADHLVPLPVVSDAPVISWLAKDVEPLAKELILLTEELASKSISTRANKARLPKEIVDEITADARWNERAKAMILSGSSDLFAKYLNESGISVELRPWIMIGVGTMQIALGHLKLISRLDKLIALANVVVPAKDEKKP